MAEVQPKDILLRVGCTPHGVITVGGARRAVGPLAPAYTHTRADGSTCASHTDRDGIVRKAPANKLRVEWVDLNGDGIRETPGILLESSRQNLILRSEEFDNAAWSKTTITFGANADVAPDGTTTADRLIEGALSQEHVVYQTLSGTTADVRHSQSVYAKAGTRSWLHLTMRDVNAFSNGVRAWYNLSTGALGTVGNVGAGSGAQAFIEKVGSWYRCKLVGAINVGDTTPVVTFAVANADAVSQYVGDGSSYISLWGGFFANNVPFVDSYIPTVGSAVTRAADALLLPFPFGPMDLTVFTRVARTPSYDATGNLGINYGDFSLGNGVPPYISGTNGASTRTIRALIDTTGSDVLNDVSIPAGATVSFIRQYRNLTTGGEAAVDVGSGLSAFVGTATPFLQFGSQTLAIGRSAVTGELGGVLLDLIIARGLRSFAEMSALAA